MADGGLDPALGAILPLVGVLVGAFTTVAWGAFQGRQQTTRDVRIAARLVGSDLVGFGSYVHVALVSNDWAGINIWWPSGIERWRKYETLLAGSLSPHEWRFLRETMRRVEVTIDLGTRREGAFNEIERRYAESTRDLAIRCYFVLDTISEHGYQSRKHRRMLNQEGVFAVDSALPEEVYATLRRERDFDLDIPNLPDL